MGCIKDFLIFSKEEVIITKKDDVKIIIRYFANTSSECCPNITIKFGKQRSSVYWTLFPRNDIKGFLQYFSKISVALSRYSYS